MTGNGTERAPGKGKILIIDDEEDIIFFLETVLEDNGYTVFAASNVSEGLELIRNEKPDLVCLDILMPEESGISLYKNLKFDPEFKRLPVIFMSGLGMSQELQDIDYLKLDNGKVLAEPAGFIEKPVDVGPFLLLVRRAIGSKP